MIVCLTIVIISLASQGKTFWYVRTLDGATVNIQPGAIYNQMAFTKLMMDRLGREMTQKYFIDPILAGGQAALQTGALSNGKFTCHGIRIRKFPIDSLTWKQDSIEIVNKFINNQIGDITLFFDAYLLSYPQISEILIKRPSSPEEAMKLYLSDQFGSSKSLWPERYKGLSKESIPVFCIYGQHITLAELIPGLSIHNISREDAFDWLYRQVVEQMENYRKVIEFQDKGLSPTYSYNQVNPDNLQLSVDSLESIFHEFYRLKE